MKHTCTITHACSSMIVQDKACHPMRHRLPYGDCLMPIITKVMPCFIDRFRSQLSCALGHVNGIAVHSSGFNCVSVYETLHTLSNKSTMHFTRTKMNERKKQNTLCTCSTDATSVSGDFSCICCLASLVLKFFLSVFKLNVLS